MDSALTFPAQKAPLGKSGGFTDSGSPAYPSTPAPGNKPGADLPRSPQSRGGTAADLLNGVIDAEERAQRNRANGLQPGEARGEAYGATIGSKIGGALGAAGGAALGGKAGAAAGTALGGPPGTAAGAAAGVAIGGTAGDVAGTQLGERLGGALGGAIGGLFDEPRPTPKPVVTPSTPPPFTGGQCPENYDIFTVVTSGGNAGPPNFRRIMQGPLSYYPNASTGITDDLGRTRFGRVICGTLSDGRIYCESLGTQNTESVSAFDYWIPSDGGADECGDPPGEPDYYTPPGSRPALPGFPRPPVPGLPGLPDGRPPTPPAGGDGNPGAPGDPYAPGLPGRPETPGGDDNPNSPNPDGSPGEDAPGTPEPQPPEPQPECDPCELIELLTEKIDGYFDAEGNFDLELTDCPTGEIDPQTGEPVIPEPQIFSASGNGLQGIYSFLTSALGAMGATFNKIPCPPTETETEDFPVIIYPSDIHSEFTLESRLLLEFTPVDDFPKRTATSSKWSLEIPNPRANLDWCSDFENFRFTKGNWYGRAIWSSSGIRSGTYCRDEAEARRVVDLISALTTLSPERVRVTSTGKTGMFSGEVRVIRAVHSVINNGVVTSCTQYTPVQC